jgi:hypothetical protein
MFRAAAKAWFLRGERALGREEAEKIWRAVSTRPAHKPKGEHDPEGDARLLALYDQLSAEKLRGARAAAIKEWHLPGLRKRTMRLPKFAAALRSLLAKNDRKTRLRYTPLSGVAEPAFPKGINLAPGNPRLLDQMFPVMRLRDRPGCRQCSGRRGLRPAPCGPPTVDCNGRSRDRSVEQ